MIKSVTIKVVLILVGILAVVFGRWFFYYDGFYQVPPIEVPNYTQIITPSSPSKEYTDSYIRMEGTILFDAAHSNEFDTEELNVLVLRLVSRGLKINFLDVEDNIEEKLLGNEADLGSENTQELGQEDTVEEASEDQREEPIPNAFVVICPQEKFTTKEIETVCKFVEDGGKLLLIDDPTRRGLTNSLSYNFGLVFEHDYLYNMKENDANYQNIFITKFKENRLTEKLQKIVLYTAGSISSDNLSIAFGDENTFSSLIETRKELSPMALAKESKVLAIYDLTFCMEPYNGIFDNNQLISNIANWLSQNTPD